MRKTIWLVLIGAYLLLIGGITWSMFAYRQKMIVSLDSIEARTAWQQWRDESARQSSTGPVLRRPVRGTAPPTEILLRDYFMPLLLGANFFATFFYVLMIWILRGAANTRVIPLAEDEAALIARQTGRG